jgi:hypothetical protein
MYTFVLDCAHMYISSFVFRHYVITGPPDSPYADGEYHGKVTFPAEYPFKVHLSVYSAYIIFSHFIIIYFNVCSYATFIATQLYI